jgi:hypothetical protein
VLGGTLICGGEVLVNDNCVAALATSVSSGVTTLLSVNLEFPDPSAKPAFRPKWC